MDWKQRMENNRMHVDNHAGCWRTEYCTACRLSVCGGCRYRHNTSPHGGLNCVIIGWDEAVKRRKQDIVTLLDVLTSVTLPSLAARALEASNQIGTGKATIEQTLKSIQETTDKHRQLIPGFAETIQATSRMIDQEEAAKKEALGEIRQFAKLHRMYSAILDGTAMDSTYEGYLRLDGVFEKLCKMLVDNNANCTVTFSEDGSLICHYE